MANRLVSNVYIIDSQLSATVPLPWGDPNNIPKMRIAAIGFYALNTAAQFQIAINNSSNVVAQYGFFFQGSVGTAYWQQMQIDRMGDVEWQQIYVPLLVNATGYLYFK